MTGTCGVPIQRVENCSVPYILACPILGWASSDCRCDLMAIRDCERGEVIAECVEGIRVEVGRNKLRMVLVCAVLGWALSPSLGLFSGSVDGNGARYWVSFWLFEGD